MFIVTTTEGVLVHKSDKDGLTEDQARASADRRNESAAELGIRTRYEVREDVEAAAA